MSEICNFDNKLINYEILKNGDLKLFLTDDGKVCQKELKKLEINDLEEKLFEDLEDFHALHPNQFGDMTQAPMLGHDIYYEDDGSIGGDLDQVWFYQYYMTSEPLEDLVEYGKVTYAQRSRFT